MKKVILDTNILLLPGQQMLDVFTEVEGLMDEPYVLVVLDRTMNELAKLAEGKGKDGRAAKLALGLVNARLAENPTVWERLVGLVPHDRNAKKLQVVKAAKYADDAIVEFADDDTVVATQDAQLKKRLKRKKVPVIVVKGKQRLAFAN